MGELNFDDVYQSGSSPDNTGKNPDQNSYVSGTDPNTVNQYQFVEEAYKGTGGFRDNRYLIAYKREAFYRDRQKYSHYVNFIKPIVKAMLDPIFNQDVSREYGDNKLFSLFIDDVNYNGLSLQRFTELATRYIRLHSVCFVIMDTVPTNEELSEADLVEGNYKPFVYLRKAQEVEDYKLDFFGRLEEIIFLDNKIKMVVEGKEEETQTYVRWTKKSWERLKKNDKKWIVLESRFHNFGILPVRPIYESERENTQYLLGDSSMYSLARINLTIYNQDSERRDLQRNQAFSILCIQHKGGDMTAADIGASTYLQISPDVTNMPSYISPNHLILYQLLNQRKQTVEDLFTVANQLGVISTSREAKSGAALAYEFSAYEVTLQKTAEIAKEVEDEIVDLFQTITGQKFEYKAYYKTDYKIRTEMDKIQMYDTAIQWSLPKTTENMIKLNTHKIFFPDAEADELKQVEKELEDMEQESEEPQNIPQIPVVEASGDNIQNQDNQKPASDNINE